MPLILTSLSNALSSLEKVLLLPKDDVTRDSAIQRFEYSYELAFKMLVRYLKITSANPGEFDGLAFKEIIRIAGEKGLIVDVGKWFLYREMRNKTSHAYDERKAEEVYSVLKDFLENAKHLLTKLEEGNKGL